MIKVLSSVAAAALMTATGALAAEPDGQAAKAEKKVCKTEKITGSLTRVRRICMTQREWDELAANHNQVISDMGRSANMAEALKGNPVAAASATSGM